MYCADYIFQKKNYGTDLDRDLEKGLLKEELKQSDESQSSKQNDKNEDSFIEKMKNKGLSFYNLLNRSNDIDLDYVFDALDENKDGVISADELQQKLRNTGYYNPSPNYVPSIIINLSNEGKNELTREEFKNLLKSK